MRLRADVFGEKGGTPLLVAHGLLGAARNWGALSRRLGRARRVIAVDMRNHGASPWSDAMDYPAMAADLAETIDAEAGGRADVLGHSMGGKAAMALALTAPDRVARLIVADIAPVAYGHSYDAILAAMRALDAGAITRRGQADAALAPAIPDPAMRAFVVQNLEVGPEGSRWRPNVAVLSARIGAILGWPDAWPHPRFEGPTLFLRGGRSDYVTDAMRPAIAALFPRAEHRAIEGAGHWLHAEKPEPFLQAVEAFLAD
ncbi:MAG: alpha/beta fold hydrolase [Rubrimonas sp.]